MTTRNIGIRLKSEGKAELKRDLIEVGEAGAAAGSSTAQGFETASVAIDKATQAQDRMLERYRKLAVAARERQSQDEQQAKFNAILGVGGGSGLRESDFLSADEASGKAGGLTRRQQAGRLNLTRQAADVFTTAAMGMNPAMIAIQQGPQVLEAISESGLKASGAVLAVGAGVAVVATAIVGLGAAQVAYESSTLKLTIASQGLGAASGQTARQLEAQAQAATAAGDVSIKFARETAVAYAETGKIGGAVMVDLVEITRRYGLATRQDAAAATKELGAAFADPIKGAAELNDKLNFLSAAEQRHIENLARAGNEAEAQALLVDRLKASILDASSATTGWDRILGDLGRTAENVWDRVGKAVDRVINGGSDVERFNALRAMKATEKAKIGGGSKELINDFDNEMAEISRRRAVEQQRVITAQQKEASRDRQGLVDRYNPNAKRLEELQGDRTRLMALGVNDPESRKALKELDEQIKALGAGYKSAAEQAAALARHNRTAARDAKADAREAEQAARKAADLDLLRLRGAVEIAKAKADPSAIDLAERELRVRELIVQLERDGLSATQAKLEAQRQVSAEMQGEFDALRKSLGDAEMAKGGFVSSVDRMAKAEPSKDFLPFAAKDAFLDSLQDNTRQSFHDGLMAGMTGGNFFEVFADRLKYAAASALADSLTTSLFGSKKSGGSGVKEGLLSALFKKIPGFAGGVDSAPGGLALVGEKGPELVELPGGSRVSTAAETRALLKNADRAMAGAGGSAVTVQVTYAPVFDARGAGPREIDALRAELQKQQQTLPDQIVLTVQDALARRKIRV